MGDLTRRVWRLDAGSRVYEGFDMLAIARWPRDGQPGEVDLTVYHPPPGLVAAIRDGERVSVLAGYEDNTGAVEIGGGVAVPKSIDYDTTSLDMPLKVQLNATTVTQRVILSGSWASTSAATVLGFIGRAAGLSIDNQSGATLDYPFGYYLEGSVSAEVETIANDLGARWSIDNTTIHLWPADGVRPVTARVWSPQTGLMFASTNGGNAGEIRATARLTPALRQGHLLSMLSTQYKGPIRVLECTHEIDTKGDTWQSSAVGVPRG